MIKWGKQFPVLVALAAVLILSAMALSSIDTPREVEKAKRVQEHLSKATIAPSQPADPAVIEKRQLEAELAAKIAAEQAAAMDKESDPVHPDRPIPAWDRNKNPGPTTIATRPINYEPRAVYLQEDFESEIFPPTGWDTVNTNPGWGWFLGTYNGGGTQCALVTWDQDGSLQQQDEWLITPEMDFSGAGSLLRMEFEFLQGYSYPHEFNIYYSLDGTNFTQFWNSDSTGYPAFEWFQTTVDLSTLIGEGSVWIAFQYYGFDADLFGVDNIVVTDDAEAVGRCCYGDPTTPDCDDVTQAECSALGGSWDGSTDCATDPCPVAGDNDICANVTPQTLPHTFTGTTVGSTYDTECQYFGDYPNVWIAFTIDSCADVEISYCNTTGGWENGWLNLITDCSCAEGTLVSGADYAFDCANGNARVWFDRLPAGTYYYPIMDDPANGASGEYVIDVSATYCPPPTPGDNCEDPLVVELGSEMLPYTLANQYTCDRFDNYSETCLGLYDGGEDLIVELVVTDQMFVNITMDPKGTSYSGFSISDACPDNGGVCIASKTGSSGDPKTIQNLDLAPGTYYIMVDTWPSPDCIPDLDLIFEESSGPQEGDNCSNPIKVDIPALPWSDLNQTTCGRGNSYEDPADDICMGYYTSGDDIFYEITVLSAVTVNFHLDPKGTSYSGMGLFTSCPPTLDNCVDFETSSSSSQKSMTCVDLEPGVYYLMIDTWASPDCVPDFDLTIVDTTCEALANDDCATASEVGEVIDLPFSTETATFDGPGGCQTAPNVWYAYKPSAEGKAIISLCGSDYDTKMAVYEGTCGSLIEIACNDDACGLQSEVELATVDPNLTYYIEVGGYGSNTGTGILNISLSDPCVYTCEGGTPEGEDCIPDGGDDVTNGGCNSATPVFGAIGCGENICGTVNTYLFDGSNYRDTDWYEFVLDTVTEVTLEATGRFPLVMGILEQTVPGQPGCDNLTGSIAPYMAVDPCSTATVEATLNPGTYYIFVGPTVYEGLGCADGPFEYNLTMSCVETDPVLCAASGGCDEYISNVEFADISNASDCGGYTDFTDISTLVEPGASYPITVDNGNGYSSDECGVWIDWNGDLNLTPDEQVTLDVATGVGPYTGTVTVPEDVEAGDYTMRIRITWNTTPAPCGTDSYGEVEDYTVTVGETAPPFMMYPETFLVISKYSVDPQSGRCMMSDAMMPEGQTVVDMEILSMELDGCPVPITGIDTLDFYGDMDAPILRVHFPLSDYIVCEEARQGGLIYDQIDSFFDIYYEIDGVPGSMTMNVPVRGHVSGDLNLDDQVNIGDLTALVEYLFMNGELEVPAIGNVNGDSSPEPNITDLTYFVDYLFRGGPALRHP